MTHLPQFAGFYIDFRLREFRTILRGCHEDEMELLEIISFDSPRGRELLAKYYGLLLLKLDQCGKELDHQRA